MRSFKKFLTFILFAGVLCALVMSLFPYWLTERVINVGDGTGTARYIAAQKTQNGVYAVTGFRGATLTDDGEYFLTLIDDDGDTDVFPLVSGLPYDYELDKVYLTGGGDVLLTLYERGGSGFSRFAVYVKGAEDATFRPLLSEDIKGFSLTGARKLCAVSSFYESDGSVYCFINKDAEYVIYSYGGSGVGLMEGASFAFKGEMTGGIPINANAAVIGFSDGAVRLIGDDGLSMELAADKRAPGRFSQYGDNVAYIDGISGMAYAVDLENYAEYGLRAISDAIPGDMDSIVFAGLSPDGGVLAIRDHTTLIIGNADGSAYDASGFLYSKRWQSIMLLSAVTLAIILLSAWLSYSVCEVRGMYMPLALRNTLALALIAFIALSTAFIVLIEPMYRNEAQSDKRAVLASYAAELAELAADDSEAIKGASDRLARTDAELYNTETAIFYKTELGDYELVSSDGACGAGARPGLSGLFPGENGRVKNAFMDRYSSIVSAGGTGAMYHAYARIDNYNVLSVSADARVHERAIAADVLRLACIVAGLGALMVIAAAVFSSVAAGGVKRITRAIAALAAGNHDVRVVQNSSDELEALATSFNEMTRSLDKTITGVKDQSELYLRFIPSQLVRLLGVNSVEQIDRSTTSSGVMAMMVVEFTFPGNVYKSSAAKLFESINEVIENTSAIVSQNGGTVYNFTYNGYDAIFDSGSAAAISTAVGIRQEIISLNDERALKGEPPVTLRIAIDNGSVMLGVVGDRDRMVPTAVSSCLNTARTLIALADKLDSNILCTKDVSDDAASYATRYIGKCRDGADAIRVYEIFDGDPYSMRSAKEMMRAQFARGVYLLYSGEFSEAKRIFMDIARVHNEDGVTRHYLYLADKYEREGGDAIYLN